MGKAASKRVEPLPAAAGREAVIVIFGCRYQKEYSGRIEEAFKRIMRSIVYPIFIFSGSDKIPQNELADFFSDKRTLIEDQSVDTMEGVRNVLELIKKHWINGLDIVIVSSWYHIPRIWLWFHYEGISIPRKNFWPSYSKVSLINVLIEPFALLAALFYINRWPVITCIKRKLGYNV